jgi:hypothetical protein
MIRSTFEEVPEVIPHTPLARRQAGIRQLVKRLAAAPLMARAGTEDSQR